MLVFWLELLLLLLPPPLLLLLLLPLLPCVVFANGEGLDAAVAVSGGAGGVDARAHGLWLQGVRKGVWSGGWTVSGQTGHEEPAVGSPDCRWMFRWVAQHFPSISQRSLHLGVDTIDVQDRLAARDIV
jgi:hypothetical protein